MIKLILIGVWGCAVALGAHWGMTYWSSRPAAAAAVAAAAGHKPGVEYKKARVLNVPIVANGAVQGYIIAHFGYTLDAKALKDQPLSPEIFLLDEAFRAIYSDENLNFRQLEKYDLNALTKTLLERVRARLNSPVVTDIVIQEFNFVSKSDLRH